MKGGFKRLSASFGKSKERLPLSSSPERGDLTASQKIQKSISMTKTILRKKIGSIPDIDAVPREFEDYKNNLKTLFSMFDDYSKFCSQMRTATVLEEQAGKQIAAVLYTFSSQLSKSEASRALGSLIEEFCKIQSTIEETRKGIFIPLWNNTRNESDAFVVSLQNTKQLSDQVSKAHLELLASVTDIIQITNEIIFTRCISIDPSEIDEESTPVEDKIDHNALYRAFLKYQFANQKYQQKLEKAMAAFESTFVQKEIQIAKLINSLFTAQKSFFVTVDAKYEILEQRYNIRESFEESEKIQAVNEKERLERKHRDKVRLDEKKWNPLIEFLISADDSILCLGTEKEEERKLLDMVITVFHAYKRSVPWLIDLISAEVAKTNEQSTLLRGNIFVTKLLLSFMRVTCGDILFVPLRELITEALETCELCEVDPKKIPEGTDIDQNILNLIELTKRFLDLIVSCLPIIPTPMRVILSHLRQETDKKFEGRGTNFAGAYVFLRFICPALVFPAKSGILPSDYEVSKNGQRCLMLISKALQNLANGVNFREDYMGKMNELFLATHIPIIREFFGEISRVPENQAESDASLLLEQVHQNELPMLYTLLHNNMETLAKNLEETGNKEKILEFASVMGRLSIVQ